jgi:ATP-dependent Lon protease
MDEVLARALVRKPEAIEWDETAVPPPAATAGDEAAGGLVAH